MPCGASDTPGNQLASGVHLDVSAPSSKRHLCRHDKSSRCPSKHPQTFQSNHLDQPRPKPLLLTQGGRVGKKEVKGLRPKRRALIRRVAGSAALSPVAATQNSWRVRGQKTRFFRRLIIFDGGQTLGRLARPLFCPPSKSLDLGRAFRWQHQFCLRARVGAWVRPVLPKSSIGLNNPADTL